MDYSDLARGADMTAPSKLTIHSIRKVQPLLVSTHHHFLQLEAAQALRPLWGAVGNVSSSGLEFLSQFCIYCHDYNISYA